jgi:hypothetical protein
MQEDSKDDDKNEEEAFIRPVFRSGGSKTLIQTQVLRMMMTIPRRNPLQRPWVVESSHVSHKAASNMVRASLTDNGEEEEEEPSRSY